MSDPAMSYPHGAVIVRGPGRKWGVICVGPEDGVCSVDEIGCGYCIGVPCKWPKRPATEEAEEQP